MDTVVFHQVPLEMKLLGLCIFCNYVLQLRKDTIVKWKRISKGLLFLILSFFLLFNLFMADKLIAFRNQQDSFKSRTVLFESMETWIELFD